MDDEYDEAQHDKTSAKKEQKRTDNGGSEKSDKNERKQKKVKA